MAEFQKRPQTRMSLAAVLDMGGLPRVQAQVKAVATKMGNVAGDGRNLFVELCTPAGGVGQAGAGNETVLRVRMPGQGDTAKVLAYTQITGTATEVHLADFASDKKPFIVAIGTWQAVSNHAGFAEVFRYENGELQRYGRFVGWYGSAHLSEEEGTPLIRVQSLFTPEHRELPFDLLHDLIGRRSPALWRFQTIGWHDGRLDVIDDQVSRLAYRLYENRPLEAPLPAEAISLYETGQALIAAGLPAEAIETLNQAITMVGDYPDALTALAKAFAALGRWEESRDAASRAVRFNPWHTGAQLSVGMASLVLGRVPEAIRALQISAAVQDERWEAHYWLGLAFEQQGDAEKAEEAFARATQLNPNAPELQHLRGR